MTDLATLEREAEAAERRAVALRKFLEVARDLGDEGLAEVLSLVAPKEAVPPNGEGHTNSHTETDKPTGRAALRIIVMERPGIWTLTELRREMIARGWHTSDKAIEAAAARLARLDGEGRRIGKGRYVFPANYGELDDTHGEEVAIESGTSGVAMITPAAA